MIPYLFTIAFAIYCAANDTRKIRNGDDINHVKQWVQRSVITVAFVASWFTFFKVSIPEAALTLLACGLLFSTVFRVVLNLMRGRDWRYVSPSSWYDWQFIRVFWRRFKVRKDCIAYHKRWYYKDKVCEQYVVDVHRAGLLATIVEVVGFSLLQLL